MAGPSSVLAEASVARDSRGDLSLVLLMVCSFFGGGRPGQKEKTHSRCRPWVFVEIQLKLEKRPRRPRLVPGRLLRLLAAVCCSRGRKLVGPARPVKPGFPAGRRRSPEPEVNVKQGPKGRRGTQ